MDTLQKANTYLNKLLTDEFKEKRIELLMDCQACAIAIGNKIEKLYGDNTESVQGLESYCETIYQLSGDGLNGENRTQLVDKTNTLLQTIRSNMETEIPDRLEVVFLPYKASMWDSLESVWFAARDDDNCDDYVVPIPYFDKTQEGSFGEMHYEGDEYPDYVPVTSWEAYDMEERRPDVVYIHNPYDEYNIVTSVHPLFYSKELKKHTEKLVYIPYFILNEVNPDDQHDLDSIKHFCVAPGVQNADEVIVQSENMRKVYINILTNETGKRSRGEWEKKIMGYGSPKIDKILQTQKEDVKIPNEWLNIIVKPDGTWKKIILYNTSVGSFLQYDKKMLEKVESILRIFEKNQDEVALLWRPHPLMKATIEAMRPQLYNKYVKLVNMYQQEGWGIYDSSADMDRAILLSDGYYGDNSSVLHLYKYLKKPIMIQNVSIEANSGKYRNIIFDNLCDDGTNYWFTSYDFNGLFQMDKNFENIKFMGFFPDEQIDGVRLYGRIISVGELLLFSPLSAKKISIYNKKDKKFSQILISLQEENKVENYMGWNYYDIIPFHNEIYFMPHQLKAIIKYNLETTELKYIDKWFTKIGSKITKENPYIFYGTCMKENYLYAPVCGTNNILIINLQNENIQYIELGTHELGYIDICFDGEKFWLLPFRGTSIICWDGIGTFYEEIEVISSDSNNILFSSCFFIDGFVWIFPNQFNKILKIDVKTKEVFYGTTDLLGYEEIQPDETILCGICGEKIYCIETQNGNAIVYYPRDKSKKNVQPKMDKEEYERIMSKIVLHKKNMQLQEEQIEERRYSVIEFLETIKGK